MKKIVIPTAAKNGYVVEVVAEGEHYDYLARIAKKIC